MDDYEMPLIEKMRKMYVLSETHDLLSAKLESLIGTDDKRKQSILDDLQKIEQELGQYRENEQMIGNHDILNGAFVFPEYEE